MSINVRKLNGDTTFLLSFCAAPDGDFDNCRLNVLIDPWLTGSSSLLHPAFQISHRVVPPVVGSLVDIAEEVDVILISQSKPDHCHRETLCSWPSDHPVRVLATPAAARKIRSWKHFPDDCVQELCAYDVFDANTLCTLAVPSRGGMSSMLTIANISSSKDLTGLHNAIGMTFSHEDEAARRQARRDSSMDTYELTAPTLLADKPTHSLRARIKSYRSLRQLNRQQEHMSAFSPPKSAATYLSCIYSPHGVSAALLEPYVDHHLRALRALPVTVLIHSITTERNPWFMGGTVAAGTPGGIDLIHSLEGRVTSWISAHDEAKNNKGLSVKLLKTERYQEDQVRTLLREHGYSHIALYCPSPGEDVYLAG